MVSKLRVAQRQKEHDLSLLLLSHVLHVACSGR